MTLPRDPIVDADLDAYVDNQLDAGRRIDVAAYLSTHPDVAARVMADLRARDELRLALAGQGSTPRPETGDAARRLERALAGSRMLNTLRRFAAVVLLVGAGWLAHAALGPIAIGEVVASTPAPAFVDDAMRAHRTEAVRAAITSLPAAPVYNPAELRSATGIVMPALPDGWAVRDVQIYPSLYGPAVEMSVETADYGPLSLFAARTDTFDVIEPTVAETGDAAAAYFQIGEVGYAVVARAGTDRLDRAAAGLARSLY